MTRTMLKEKGLPKQFWAEAVVYSTYFLNRCPTSKWRARLLKRHRAITRLISHTYEFLGVFHMLKHLKSKGRSLTIMVKNAFSSDIARSRRHTSSIIH